MQRRKPQRFDLPDGEGTITASDLRRAGRETQLEVMRNWFTAKYEDPIENTPYESAEGGYIYIWGGPYDPGEELENQFGGIVPDKIIEELAEELRAIAWEWTGRPDSDDIDDFFYDSIAISSKHLEAFQNSLRDITALLDTRLEDCVEQCFLRLLYVNVITALETYLSDLFISSINADRNLLRRFVETNPEFKSEKISISDVFKASEGIEQKVKSYLMDVVWHHLARVKPMFKDTLEVEFPTDMSGLFKAVLIRHDLVHRNGKSKDGVSHVISKTDISDLIRMVEAFVSEIEVRWQAAKSASVSQTTPAEEPEGEENENF